MPQPAPAHPAGRSCVLGAPRLAASASSARSFSLLRTTLIFHRTLCTKTPAANAHRGEWPCRSAAEPGSQDCTCQPTTNIAAFLICHPLLAAPHRATPVAAVLAALMADAPSEGSACQVFVGIPAATVLIKILGCVGARRASASTQPPASVRAAAMSCVRSAELT